MNDSIAPSRVLGIFGMSIFTRRGDLEKLFEEYGPIEKVEIIHNRQVSTWQHCTISFTPTIFRLEDQRDSGSFTLSAKRTPNWPVSRPTASS